MLQALEVQLLVLCLRAYTAGMGNMPEPLLAGTLINPWTCTVADLQQCIAGPCLRLDKGLHQDWQRSSDGAAVSAVENSS